MMSNPVARRQAQKVEIKTGYRDYQNGSLGIVDVTITRQDGAQDTRTYATQESYFDSRAAKKAADKMAARMAGRAGVDPSPFVDKQRHTYHFDNPRPYTSNDDDDLRGVKLLVLGVLVVVVGWVVLWVMYA